MELQSLSSLYQVTPGPQPALVTATADKKLHVLMFLMVHIHKRKHWMQMEHHAFGKLSYIFLLGIGIYLLTTFNNLN